MRLLMNHLDLFSGIGGFSLAIQRAGIEHGWHGYSEIDTYANDIISDKPYTAVAKTLQQIKSLLEIDADETFLELCEGYIGTDMYNHDEEIS